MSEHFQDFRPDAGNGFLPERRIITGQHQDLSRMYKGVFYVVALRRRFRQGAVVVIVLFQYFQGNVGYPSLEFLRFLQVGVTLL